MNSHFPVLGPGLKVERWNTERGTEWRLIWLAAIGGGILGAALGFLIGAVVVMKIFLAA